MKKLIVITSVLVGIFGFALGGLTSEIVLASVEGITAENYLDYEKPIKDSYGFNKGESEGEYLKGEEYFYNDYYDHWNVDRVYDEKLIPTEEQNEPVTKEEKNYCPYCGSEL